MNNCPDSPKNPGEMQWFQGVRDWCIDPCSVKWIKNQGFAVTKYEMKYQHSNKGVIKDKHTWQLCIRTNNGTGIVGFRIDIVIVFP